MASTRPNIAEILGPILQRVPAEHRPLLLAIAERRAAARYRDWASGSTDEGHRARLRACADREEEIARRVEDLYPEAAVLQRGMFADHPDLEEVNRTIFAGRPLPEQFRTQAEGERLGAATWRAIAEHASAEARRTFLACAELEEASAAVLESILSEG